MKKISVFLFFIVFSFISCNKQELSDSFSLGLENEFKINGVYHSSDNSLKFSITEINDSRCPSDVVCVWAGKADVKIKVESPFSGNLVLSTMNNGFYKNIDTLGNYSFQLVDVSPYPISTEEIKLEDYSVTLKIETLN
jgi:hypothetical protein